MNDEMIQELSEQAREAALARYESEKLEAVWVQLVMAGLEGGDGWVSTASNADALLEAFKLRFHNAGAMQ